MEAYLDNAATSPIAPEVVHEISDVLSVCYGNPSSSHSQGRKARAKLEGDRKMIAKLFNAASSNIIFTSGGTEANNLAIQSVINGGKVGQVITTDIEHHAVLHTIEKACESKAIPLFKLKLDHRGEIDLADLEQLLTSGEKSFVSLMHGNNEIGNLLPLQEVSSLCKQHGAVFHCDTVQTVGHQIFDLQKTPVDYITCSAHKIHGPKGVGFLYVSKGMDLNPLFFGGKQERGFRPGTENVASIAGMAKAISLAYGALEANEKHILERKVQLQDALKREVPGISFNGSSNGMNTVLSVQVDTEMDAGMLLFQLDLKGVCVSGGSACSSGSLKGSHVLSAINADNDLPSLRFSISRITSKEEISYAVACLKEILKK